MVRRLVPVFVISLVLAPAARTAEDKKTDGEITVKEGEEFKLTKDTITIGKRADGMGRFEVTVKAGEAKVVKMPAQTYMLGFTPDEKKTGGVGVASVLEDGPLGHMRTKAGQAKNDAGDNWNADPGDVITHVNGHAVKTVKELTCAVNTAEDKDDIQIVIKDVDTGKQYVFYVTATKRK
jgi:S1-C subfamily serine protease